jgi:hypothetical protein
VLSVKNNRKQHVKEKFLKSFPEGREETEVAILSCRAKKCRSIQSLRADVFSQDHHSVIHKEALRKFVFILFKAE